ncbi:hypothetical protein ACSVBT_07035 [Afipia sp. TerB]
MLIRATREFYDDVGMVKAGQIINMTDFRGMDLIRRGLATNAQGEAAEGGAKGPTLSQPIASPIGAEKQPLSSPADQALQMSISPRPEAAPASSASITDTNSPRGPMLCTPATAHGGKRIRGRRRSRV